MKGQQSRAFLIPSLDCLAHALAVPTRRCLLSLAADWNLNLVVAFSDFVVRFPIVVETTQMQYLQTNRSHGMAMAAAPLG